MRRAGRSKRVSSSKNSEQRSFTLMVHGIEYGTGEELVINPECFPDVKVNDLLEITQPSHKHERLILQVGSLAPVRGKLQISILKELAAQFRLEAFHDVVVQRVDPRDVAVDYMELTFKDQFLSRADIWRYKVAMFGKCVYVGKSVELLGVRSQVEALLANNHKLLCGVVSAETKMIVRSRSSRLFWLIQMSTEMWEFAADGELYYEKLINRLLRVLIGKWTECSVSHSLTIIAFSRSYYDRSQFPSDYDPDDSLFKEPHRQGHGPGCDAAEMASGYGPTVHVDAQGRYYEDFYKVLVMNFTGPDWSQLLQILKREFTQYHRTHRWRQPHEHKPVEYEIRQVSRDSGAQSDLSTAEESGEFPAISSVAEEESEGGAAREEAYVQWKTLPYGVPARAAEGNILEAINVTMNILDKHYMDRDLNRTGQGIVMITAGTSVFHVDQQLAQITKQRMMDNGVGMDMISLTTPPLHVVPLFIFSKVAPEAMTTLDESTHVLGEEETKGASADAFASSKKPRAKSSSFGGSATLPDSSGGRQEYSKHDTERPKKLKAEKFTYNIPHWVNITFLDFDCHCDAPTDHFLQSRSSGLNPETSSARAYSEWAQTSGGGGGVGSDPASGAGESGDPLSTSSSSATSLHPNLLKNHLNQRTCECQIKLNYKFHPLPPFRMFDPTVPGDKLTFPVSLKRLMLFDQQQELLKGSSSTDGYLNPSTGDRVLAQPLSFRVEGETGFADWEMQQGLAASPSRRKLSDISDTLNASQHNPPAQWQLSKSPDYEVSLLSARTHSMYPASGGSSISGYGSVGSLTLNREALLDYDAAVFSPAAKVTRSNAGSSGNITSRTIGPGTIAAWGATLSGGNNSIGVESSVRNGKVQFLADSSSGVGLASSLVSPRNEAMLRPRRNPNSLFSKSSASSKKRSGDSEERSNEPSTNRPAKSNTSHRFPSGMNTPRDTRMDNQGDFLQSPQPFVRANSLMHTPPPSSPATMRSPSEDLLARSVESARVAHSPHFAYSGAKGGKSQRIRALTAMDSKERHVEDSFEGESVCRTPPIGGGSLMISSPSQNSRAFIGHVSLRRVTSDGASCAFNAGSGGRGGSLSGPMLSSSWQSHFINPFKPSKDLEATSLKLTSNRRRWSHLFPVSKAEFHISILLGPNWKSLTSPATLPLTTDYYPSPKDLHTSYTESFYTLTLPSTTESANAPDTVPRYRNHHELLIEMVSQRLASDFQLVATENRVEGGAAVSHRATVGSVKRGSGTGTAASGSGSGSAIEGAGHSNTRIYHLSMGHRIHQMIYDEELQTIEVKRYFKRALTDTTNDPVVYTYSLWVEQTQGFQPFQQQFYEYPQPEDNWNALDHMLCGYLDEMSDMTKCRRIRFAIVPPLLTALEDRASEIELYTARFGKFIDYIQSRACTSESKLAVKMTYGQMSAPSPSPSTSELNIPSKRHPRRSQALSIKICCNSPSRLKLDSRNEWIVFTLEDTFDVSRTYHFDVRWMACSGVVAEDFVSTIKRKAKQSGLEMRRIPEYSSISFLQIHPVIAPILMPLPPAKQEHQQRSLEAQLEKNLGFILDDEKLAEARGIGYGLGISSEQRRPRPRLSSAFPRRFGAASEARREAMWRTRGYRQYMHRQLPIFVRVIRHGLIWIPGYEYDADLDESKVEELFASMKDVIVTITKERMQIM